MCTCCGEAGGPAGVEDQAAVTGDDRLAELITVRDWLRHAVTRFNAAGLAYGHGTASALDEAAFLILETLHLPIDQLEPWLDARLATPERVQVRDIIEARIAGRKPASYLTGTAYIRGRRFAVDERTIVPRSYIGELLSDLIDEPEAELAMLRRVAERSGRPMSISVLQRDHKPEEWRLVMQRIGEARQAGTPIFGHVPTRATNVLFGFEISQNPFMDRPGWREISGLPFEARVARLRDPAFRARILAEKGTSGESFARRITRWERIFPLGDPPDYEPAPEHSIAAEAQRRGVDPAALAYDTMLGSDGRALLLRPLTNFAYGTLDTVHDMLRHPNTLVGLGDGGAHVSIISDASSLAYMLTHWSRDRTRGPKLPLPWVVKRLTSDNATAVGLADRGVVRPGAKADINIIDYDKLTIRPPRVAYDLPGGGRRLVQHSDGFVATLVGGEAVMRDGQATGKLPGRLVRGPQGAAAA